MFATYHYTPRLPLILQTCALLPCKPELLRSQKHDGGFAWSYPHRADCCVFTTLSPWWYPIPSPASERTAAWYRIAIPAHLAPLTVRDWIAHFDLTADDAQAIMADDLRNGDKPFADWRIGLEPIPSAAFLSVCRWDGARCEWTEVATSDVERLPASSEGAIKRIPRPTRGGIERLRRKAAGL